MKKLQKSNSPFYKKWWFWAIVVLLVIGIIGGGNGENDTDPTLDPETTVSEQASTGAAADETTGEPTEATEPQTVSTTAEPPTDPTETAPEETTPPKTDPPETSPATEPTETFILNTNTNKFHDPGCRSVKDIKDENKQEFTGTREEVIAMKYEPCGICHP